MLEELAELCPPARLPVLDLVPAVQAPEEACGIPALVDPCFAVITHCQFDIAARWTYSNLAMDTAILTLSVLCAILALCLVAVTLLAMRLARAMVEPLVLGAESRVLAPRRGDNRTSSASAVDYDDDAPPTRAAPRVTVPPKSEPLWSPVPGGVDPFKRGPDGGN